MKFSLRRKRKQKKNLNKYKLRVKQNENSLEVTGEFRKQDYFAKELCIKARYSENIWKVAEIDPSSQFQFILSLEELINLLKQVDEESIFDYYIKVRRPYSEEDQEKVESGDYALVEEGNLQFLEYLIRLGRFENTYFHGFSHFYRNEDYLVHYINAKGFLSIKYNDEPISPVKLQIDLVKASAYSFRFEGKIFTKSSRIVNGQILLRGRESRNEYVLDTLHFNQKDDLIIKKYGLGRYWYEAIIHFDQINAGQLLDDDIYDLYFKLKFNDNLEERIFRVGRPTSRAKLFIKDMYAKNNQVAAVIHPYYTFKQANLSFEVYKFPLDTFRYLRKTMRWSWFIRLRNRNRKVWLIGERTYKAQDTGYAFFKFIRRKHPNMEAFYVIDKNSRESANVEPLGNVIDYKSKEHIFYSIIAKKVISSHHPDYLYPIRTAAFKKKVKADKVFLQHGVMGTKNMVANYGKNAPSGFDTDFFMVSSDFEKDMIVNDFGYEPEEVFVTGLSRFDTLFAKDVEVKRQILIIPTWRDWIINDEMFFESEYYERYRNLMNNEDLHKLAKDHDFEIVFCLHPNMQRFSKYFENPSVRIINQGEVDVQRLIKESALMITDYSSVGFDFSFLHKPVVYYQFDRARFIGQRPSHLDLDNDLPGEIVVNENDIIELITDYAKNGFRMKEQYIKRANKFIKYRDLSSSERIFRVINENQAKKHILHNPKVELVKKGAFNRFRRSKYYFPTMKLFYKVGKLFIRVDKNLILFESGLGKQYSDSPRYIYEEILNRNLNYKKVWVYNKQHRFPDHNTKKIKRLSPQYYYYLLKAGYWVNNQNFPTYIKKRPQTIYLQTWHGTPLKKMLYDLDQVFGRDDGYIDRVGSAVKNWNYLVSPSPYATKAFRSAFHYEKDVLEVGYPRNDIFYKPERFELAEKVRNRLHLPAGKKVILYAPTFRDNQTTKNNKFTFEIEMDLDQMKEELGDEYIILLRLHVVVSSKLKIDESIKDFAFNVSNYPDIQELMLVSDMLMTDYSSVFFDYANTGNPILFFTYDLEEYRDDLRGFYMDLEKEAPGPLVFNTEDIIHTIKNIDIVNNQYKEKYKKFQETYCPLEDGNASKRVVDRVFR